MYCPNPDCSHRKETGHPAEYRDGIETCADCGAALVAEPIGDLAEDVEALDLEPLTAITEPAFGALLRGVLDEAGIRHAMRGEGVQDLFTVGRLGTGYNLLTGPGKLYVERARASEAREILLALADGGEPIEAEELVDDDER
jgi:hypothetical protein